MKKLLLAVSIVLLLVGCTKEGNSSTPTTQWNEGFDTSWAGTYSSRPDDDYAVTFKIDNNGNYSFVYGTSFTTTYTGKYNRNFSNGTSKSQLNYKITGIRVAYFEEKKSITITVYWVLPKGNNTESYVLYRR
jgi:hypothetical protein